MSFEDFFNQTFKNTFRFFYYRGVGFNSVDDLVQECYLRFYQKYQDKLTDFNESKKIIGGIAGIVLKEWQRKEYGFKIVELTDEVVDQELFEFYSSEKFETDFHEKQHLLYAALQELNPRVRQVLELRFLHNKSRKEVAQNMDMSEDQVHTYQKRGVKYLKDKLNGDPAEKEIEKSPEVLAGTEALIN